jgi:hypothetical protein
MENKSNLATWHDDSTEEWPGMPVTKPTESGEVEVGPTIELQLDEELDIAELEAVAEEESLHRHDDDVPDLVAPAATETRKSRLALQDTTGENLAAAVEQPLTEDEAKALHSITADTAETEALTRRGAMELWNLGSGRREQQLDNELDAAFAEAETMPQVELAGGDLMRRSATDPSMELLLAGQAVESLQAQTEAVDEQIEQAKMLPWYRRLASPLKIVSLQSRRQKLHDQILDADARLDQAKRSVEAKRRKAFKQAAAKQ